MDKGRAFLGDLVFYRTYAKTGSDGYKESWSDCVDRNKEMYLKKFPHLRQEIERAYVPVYDKRVLASMRSFQFAGEPIERSSMRAFNCSFLHIDSFQAMAELFWVLMNGTGVGYSVQSRHVCKLPVIQNGSGETHLIKDNKEAWADSIKILCSNPQVKFDYSPIRPKDAPISTGGYASGPESLEETHEKIRRILKDAVGRRLKTIEVHDICCIIADVVVVGSVRRAALIALFDAWDQDMLAAKAGEWWVNTPYRARANNSAVVDRSDPSAQLLYNNVMTACQASGAGEPGVVWTNNLELGVNPCQPGWANLLTPTGIRMLKDIQIGDEVWSGKTWTKVVNKWSTGVKDVFKYVTSNGVFYGTENHRVFQKGERVEARDASSIDACVGPCRRFNEWDPQDVMDGLVFGDGTVHKASNNLVLLHIGSKDFDYLESGVSNLIIKHRPGVSRTTYEVATTITAEELPHTYNRVIPDRFYYGTYEKKAGFLRGLFSANGCVTANRVQFKTTSKKQAEQVQEMLSSMGLKSSLCVNKPSTVQHHNGVYTSRESYNIVLYSSSEEFMDCIGFLQEYKNNSLVRNTTPRSEDSPIKEVVYVSTEEVFDITVEADEHSYWTSGLLVSNCAEIALNSMQVCNLTEINAAMVYSYGDFLEALQSAIFIGALQASLTDFPYVRPQWKYNSDKEALLGVSLTGLAENWDRIENWLPAFGGMVPIITKSACQTVGVNNSARVTCIKPSGTASTLLGTTAGIHAAHDQYYVRRVRVEKVHPLAHILQNQLGSFVEEDKFVKDNLVVSVPCSFKSDTITRSSEDALGLFNRVLHVSDYWIKPGHNYGDNTHNVSCTLSVKDNEWEPLKEAMWKHKDQYTGLSILPYDGGSYVQAPYESISPEMFKQLSEWFPWDKIDLTKANYKGYKEDQKQELACSGGACEIQ